MQPYSMSSVQPTQRDDLQYRRYTRKQQRYGVFFNNGIIKMYCRQHINLAGGRVELFNISARICGYNTRITRVDGVSDGFFIGLLNSSLSHNIAEHMLYV